MDALRSGGSPLTLPQPKVEMINSNSFRKAIGRLRGQVYIDRWGDYRDTVLLAGGARSGSTWLSEIINHDNEYRYIFEPFHPNRLDITRHFKPRQYLRPDDADPRYLEPATRILKGRIRSIWTDKYNHKTFPRKRVVKEVRGNLLLGWIRHRFPEVPIVFLIRHPLAVVHSQRRLTDWNWHEDMTNFLSQPDLMEDHVEPFRDLMVSASSEFERLVLLWCIENYVPIRQLSPGDVHLAFYEDLWADPEPNLRGLFAFLGKKFDPAMLGRLSVPSAVTRSDSAVMVGGSPVDSWVGSTTAQEIEAATRVLGEFGLDRVYGPDGVRPLTRMPLELDWRA